MKAFLIQTASLLFFCSVATSEAQSSSEKFWIFFRDKGSNEQSLSFHKANPASLARSIGISDESMKRRAKVLPADSLISRDDLPLAPEYIKAIELRGVKVISESRWMNAISIVSDSISVSKLSMPPFVARVNCVHGW